MNENRFNLNTLLPFDLDVSKTSDDLARDWDQDQLDEGVVEEYQMSREEGAEALPSLDNAAVMRELQRLTSALHDTQRDLREEKQKREQDGGNLAEEQKPPVGGGNPLFDIKSVEESRDVRRINPVVFSAASQVGGRPVSIKSVSTALSYVLPKNRVHYSAAYSTPVTVTAGVDRPIPSINFHDHDQFPVFDKLPPPRGDNTKSNLTMISNAVSTLAELLKKAYKPRGIPPPKFNAEKGKNLRIFFKKFDRYCQLTFPDQPEDWLTLLGNFLEGSYSDLYDRLTENDEMDYSGVRSALLQWWESDTRMKDSRAAQEFMLAKMKPGESIKMFALRLGQLANRAYPGVNMSIHETLRRAFLHNLPAEIEQAMSTYLLNHEGRSGRKMTFNEIVQLAQRHYDELGYAPGGVLIEPEVITISQVKSQPLTQTWSEVVKQYAPREKTSKNGTSKGNKNQKKQNNSPANEQESSVKQQYKFCTNCGKNSHDISTCFLYNNICSFCKEKGHIWTECVVLKKRRSEKDVSNDKAAASLNCPHCSSRDHLGIDCDNKPSTSQASPKPQRNQGARPKQRTQHRDSNADLESLN